MPTSIISRPPKPLVAALALLSMTACMTSRRHVERLGSSHVSVLSVTDFEDYKAALSPKYETAASKALELAVPDTTQIENTILEAFRARAGMQIAPTGVLKAGFAEPSESQPNVTRSGQNIPSSELASSTPMLDSSEQAPTVLNVAGLKTDPFLSYLAGTALFQEIKMLERYTLDAAVAHGYQAFIVRLQVTNMPFSNEGAYDAYANIGFYLSKFTSSVALANASYSLLIRDRDLRSRLGNVESYLDTATLPEKLALLSQVEGEVPRGDQIRSQLDDTMAKLRAALTERQLPRVIPLLVTDQVEAALNGRRAERLRQLNFALAAAYSGLGAKVDLEKVDQAINRAVGRDYGSLFTVGRLADNAVRIRIGARKAVSNEKGNGAQTMARTHNVTLLLLLPEYAGYGTPCPVNVGVRWEYRDPATGVRMTGPTNHQTTKDIEGAASQLVTSGNYGIPGNYPSGITGAHPKTWEAIVRYAQSNEYEEFRNTLLAHPKPIAVGQLNRLWLDLVSAKLGGNHDTTTFTVATKPKPAPSLSGGDAYVVDDAEKSVAIIPGTISIDPLKLSALWRNLVVGSSTPQIALAAQKTELRGKDQIVLEFPSLIKLGVAEKGAKINATGEIALQHDRVALGTTRVASVVLAGSKPTSKMALASNTKVITPPDDKASPKFTLRTALTGPTADAAKAVFNSGAIDPQLVADAVKAKKLYLIAFDGADAAIDGSTSPVHQIAEKGIFAVVGSGVATFVISNVPDGGKFKIVTTAPDGGETVADIEITVKKKEKE